MQTVLDGVLIVAETAPEAARAKTRLSRN